MKMRVRKDTAGNRRSTKGIGLGSVENHAKVNDKVRKEHV